MPLILDGSQGISVSEGSKVIADGAIDSAALATGAVNTVDLANSAVTIEKISATGTANSSTFLRGDGSWQAPSGGGIGSGQSWQNPSRANGTTYTNTTGNPIFVVITQRLNAWVNAGPFTYTITVGGVTFLGNHGNAGTNVVTNFQISFIVPDGVSYSASGGTLIAWSELR